MNITHCGETVRRHDPDRFLLTMFAPAGKRPALWALYAFNYEIARTREVVTDTHLGLIRLQWWRDALKSGAPGHPVVEPLLDAVREYGLPPERLESLIYAREFDLEDRAPATLDGMVKYAEFTSAPLMDLALSISGGIPAKAGILSRDPGMRRDDSLKIATAYALTGLLRAVPVHARQRRCYLPADRVPFVGEIYEGKRLEDLAPVVEAVVEKARELLSSSASAQEVFPKLHAALASMYLGQIEKAGYNVFSPRLAVPPFGRELRLWWAEKIS